LRAAETEDVGVDHQPERDHAALGFLRARSLITWSICLEVSLSVPFRAILRQCLKHFAALGPQGRT